MKKVLYVCSSSLDGKTGGSQGLLKELDGLKQNFSVDVLNLEKESNKIKTFLRLCLLNGGNLDSRDYHIILNRLLSKDYEIVYLSSSNLGKVACKIKNRFPKIKVVVNYQNNEKKYSFDMFKTKGLLYFPLFLSSCYNEFQAQRYADLNIFVSNEDKVSMKCRNNSVVIPVTLKDYFKNNDHTDARESYILFLGAAQYANIEAAKLLINQIAPCINIKCVIAGTGMKKEFPGKYDNVEVYGFIPDLCELFKYATAFVMPLYYGSGAKVKVAEALMHGKKVIGTSLSFFGYKLDNIEHAICDSIEDFIREINNLNQEEKFYEKNRNAFLDFYSSDNNKNYYSIINSL